MKIVKVKNICFMILSSMLMVQSSMIEPSAGCLFYKQQDQAIQDHTSLLNRLQHIISHFVFFKKNSYKIYSSVEEEDLRKAAKGEDTFGIMPEAAPPQKKPTKASVSNKGKQRPAQVFRELSTKENVTKQI